MRQVCFKEMGSDAEDIRRIYGDGLLVKLDSNDRILEVTGDGCRITMAKNCGSVRVVGDGCRLKIAHNVGDVEYTGDGGQVLLGPKSSKENVKYFGDGGRVTIDNDAKKASSAKERKTAAANVNQKVEDPRGKTSRRKTDVREGRSTERNENSRTRSLDVEEQNLANEMKEMRRNSRRTDEKSKGQGGRNDENIIVTTKFVGLSEDERYSYVKKWIVNPGTLIKSFDGDSSIKVLRKQVKINAECN